MTNNDSNPIFEDQSSAREIEKLRQMFKKIDLTKRTLARLDVDRMYRPMVASLDVTKQLQKKLAGIDINRTHRDLVASIDVTKQTREMLAALDVNRTHRDLVASIDVAKQTREMLAALDVNRTYRDLVASIDVAKQTREMLASLDVNRTFHDLVAPLAGISAQDLLASVSVAEPLVDALGGLDEAIGTDAGLAEIAAAIDGVELPPRVISEAARYAIAVYIALLVLSLCAAFYFWHTDLAQLALDASTPVSWSLMIGQLVFRRLGESGDGAQPGDRG